MPDAKWELTDRHLRIGWREPRRCLSSAPLGGGLVNASGLFNVRVSGNYDDASAPPENTLADYAALNRWHGVQVGMMTAASMNSFRQSSCIIDGFRFAVGLTCGLSNARRAGDPADWVACEAAAPPAGTINLVMASEQSLRDDAMVELLMITTEARAVALAELGIVSPVSGRTATGTGTDATAIISGPESSQPALRWCGKHTSVGEQVAQLVIDAVFRSVGRRC